MRYLADRFGTDPITAIVQSPANGIDGIDAVLQEEGSSFETIFGDWVAANAIGDTSVGDGRYGYQTADINPAPDRRIDQYPTNYSAGVNQYGTDYVVLEPEEGLQGELQLIFHGRPSVQLLPTEPTSGQDLWWSNRGDAGYSYLEREFDLTDVSQAALDYNLWYEIEDGWDYAYVRVSTDGGQTWAFLRGAHMTDDNPVGNALGVGYTGYSGLSGDTSGSDAEWVNESLDLTPYCGGKVLLRFEYVTDDAVNEPGLCLDDLRLDAIGFADDAESDAGWTASGFIRNDNRLTQGYLVQAITYTTTGNVEVQRIAVDASGRGELNVDGLGGQVQQVVLTISGLAPVTTERATYALDLKLLDETPGESALLGGQDGT
jgi:immune inhibitor A